MHCRSVNRCPLYRQLNSYAILRISENRKAEENANTMKTIILQTLAPFTEYFETTTNHRPLLRRSILVPVILVCFALCQQLQSAPNTPDPGPLPASNTADGQGALQGLTTGIYNSAFGIYALLSNAEANFNTGVGAGTLLANTAGENTATGAGGLLSNTTGNQNTANGAFALFNNSEGIRNTAVGARALLNNLEDSNTAVGVEALGVNTTGAFNVAVGGSALLSNVIGASNTAVGVGSLSQSTGDGNTALGRIAGFGVTTGNNIIAIGQLSGVDSDLGQLDDSCYIDNIANQPISAANLVGIVGVDSDGKLGTFTVDANGNKVPVSSLLGGQPQAVLDRKFETLQARIAQQQQQIEILTSHLKEQTVLIQKVSAQMELRTPSAQTVLNK